MPIDKTPSQQVARKIGIGVVAIIAFIILAMFIGFNLYHADAQRDLNSGQFAPRDAPKSPTDLQAPRPPQK
ncbi:MAG: hypothetical protein EOO23_01905 [Comamonadaceae bacterium]|nr:MAG: hypothetical protein EOO23_01905 [Comamonadaceae bacterium]